MRDRHQSGGNIDLKVREGKAMPWDVLDTLQKLPPMCAARHPSDNSVILIKRGVMGYWKAPAGIDPDLYNERRGITAAQVEAMQIGSMFGWDVPGVEIALLQT